MNDEVLWALERRFWLEGVAIFRERLADDCLMLFPPPVGALAGADILAGLETAPRWTSVEITARRLLRPGPDIAILAYRAEARRGDEPAYVALCSSTYAGTAETARLVFHQQTT